MKKLYFSLAPTIYAAKLKHSVIILNLATDDYISLIEEAADYLPLITGHPVLFDGTHYTIKGTQKSSEDITYWVNYFQQEHFIVSCEKKKLVRHVAATPKESGGLIDYKWDAKVTWKPFKETSFLLTMQALWLLIRVHRIMKRKGIGGLKQAITTTKTLQYPTAKEIQKLSAAVDAASLLYPKKTLCLAWAATFVLLAQKKGLQSCLTIGVQTDPFYAHAWAQVKNQVIHDDPKIAQVLSVIFKEPTTSHKRI